MNKKLISTVAIVVTIGATVVIGIIAKKKENKKTAEEKAKRDAEMKALDESIENGFEEIEEMLGYIKERLGI